MVNEKNEWLPLAIRLREAVAHSLSGRFVIATARMGPIVLRNWLSTDAFGKTEKRMRRVLSVFPFPNPLKADFG
jgi:hypothetical protein